MHDIQINIWSKKERRMPMSETGSKIMSGVKTSAKVTNLVSRLNPRNQAYVLNAINAPLFAQQASKGASKST